MAALLTVKSIQMTTATVTVNSEIVPRVNAYAAFTSSTPDAVIVEHSNTCLVQTRNS